VAAGAAAASTWRTLENQPLENYVLPYIVDKSYMPTWENVTGRERAWG